MSNGKGDSPRNCFSEQFKDNYNEIFNKNKLCSGDKIKIEKIEGISLTNLYIGYWAEGIVIDSPKIGESFKIFRVKNILKPDESENYGVFYTSSLKDIEYKRDHILIFTQNSVYKIIKL